MVSADSQLRVVASWYALLGAMCSVIASVHFHMLSAFRQQESYRAAYEASHRGFLNTGGIGNPVPSLVIFTSAAAVSWVSFVLSLRYLALSPRGQFAALVISILLALETILVAWLAAVTFFDLSPVVCVYWVIAGVCSLCSFLLWRHRRASNSRWRGP
jgi:hypothetical protein